MSAGKVFVQINNDVVELTGVEKEQFLEEQKEMERQRLASEAELVATEEARRSAISKLEALGLTVDEVQAAFGLKS